MFQLLRRGQTPRVQVPNNHIPSTILTYITTILKPSTSLLGPLDPWGKVLGNLQELRKSLESLEVEAKDLKEQFERTYGRFPKIRGTLFGGPYNKDPTI